MLVPASPRPGCALSPRAASTEISESRFDRAMQGIADAADRVKIAQGNVRRKSVAHDLLTRLGAARDELSLAVRGDRQALNRVFAANGCERIGRLRWVLASLPPEEIGKDERWQDLLNLCSAIEAVLKELGTFRPWSPPEGDSMFGPRGSGGDGGFADDLGPTTAQTCTAPGPDPLEDRGEGADLEVSLTSAEDVADPEYRAFDFARTLFNADARLSSAYVELRMGAVTKQTAPLRCERDGGTRCVNFQGERIVFRYSGQEQKLEVKLYDRRTFQGTIRGDPLVGEGTLTLEGVDDRQLHSVPVELARRGKRRGTLHMAYRLK